MIPRDYCSSLPRKGGKQVRTGGMEVAHVAHRQNGPFEGNNCECVSGGDNNEGGQ